MSEIVKVSKPIANARHWIIRDINRSRIERVRTEDMPNNIKNVMKDIERHSYFMATYINHHWVINPTTIQGEDW